MDHLTGNFHHGRQLFMGNVIQWRFWNFKIRLGPTIFTWTKVQNRMQAHLHIVVQRSDIETKLFFSFN